jgi:anthranilate synthase/aminodeoxychorismate synthase-like glutamine amidotransferase
MIQAVRLAAADSIYKGGQPHDSHDRQLRSFTYNLVQYLANWRGGGSIPKRRHNRGADRLHGPEAIFLSPPLYTREAGISVDVIRHFHTLVPILGVCLGHQSIGYAFGARIVRADRIMHGKTSPVLHDGRTLFSGLGNPFTAGRYHSLIVEREGLPDCLEVSARTAEGEIMGLRHRLYPVEGDPVSPGIDPHPQRQTDSQEFPIPHPGQKGANA